MALDPTNYYGLWISLKRWISEWTDNRYTLKSNVSVKITVSSSPPSSPNVNDLWVQTS